MFCFHFQTWYVSKDGEILSVYIPLDLGWRLLKVDSNLSLFMGITRSHQWAYTRDTEGSNMLYIHLL